MIRKEFGKLDAKIKLIKKEEDRLNKVIQFKINTFMTNRMSGKEKVNNPLNTFNPLTAHLYFKTSYVYFKTFINNYEEVSKNKTFFKHGTQDGEYGDDLMLINNQLLENQLQKEMEGDDRPVNTDQDEINKLNQMFLNMGDRREEEKANKEEEPPITSDPHRGLMSRTNSKMTSNLAGLSNPMSIGSSQDRLIMKENQF